MTRKNMFWGFFMERLISLGNIKKQISRLECFMSWTVKPFFWKENSYPFYKKRKLLLNYSSQFLKIAITYLRKYWKFNGIKVLKWVKDVMNFYLDWKLIFFYFIWEKSISIFYFPNLFSDTFILFKSFQFIWIFFVKDGTARRK